MVHECWWQFNLGAGFRNCDALKTGIAITDEYEKNYIFYEIDIVTFGAYRLRLNKLFNSEFYEYKADWQMHEGQGEFFQNIKDKTQIFNECYIWHNIKSQKSIENRSCVLLSIKAIVYKHVIINFLLVPVPDNCFNVHSRDKGSPQINFFPCEMP